MSEDEDSRERNHHTSNSVGDHGIVGMQADQVHNSNVYITHQGDSPKELYDVGIRYLRGGVPAKARILIDDAIARGLDGPEVHFHWALAMFGKRSWADLGTDEQQRVLSLAELLPAWRSGEWRSAVGAIVDVARSLRKSRVVSSAALDTIDAVPAVQRALIVQHLDLVLTGAAKDRSWTMTSEMAKAKQQARGRRGRVWAYFYPEPVGPRNREVVSPDVSTGAKVHQAAWYFLLVVGVVALGQVVLTGPSPELLIALVLMSAAAVTAVLAGQDIHYFSVQLATKERFYERRHVRARGRGFAQNVDESFERYLQRYLVDERERSRFEVEARGPLVVLRDEIVEDYRESRTTIRQVNWLIQHSLRRLIDDWRRGTLYDYRRRYRTPVATVWVCMTAVVGVAVSGSFLVAAAVDTRPIVAVPAALAVLVGGARAVPRQIRTVTEQRCSEAAREERDTVMRGRHQAFVAWQQRLRATRPSEEEMETWLDCDKKILLDRVLRDYRLPWSEVVVHAFLLLPSERSQRAKEAEGPWRYSGYDLRLFLLTRRGVREVSAQLVFVSAFLRVQEHHTFRFDALSCVRVQMTGRTGYVLEITLTNGNPRSIRVADAVPMLTDDPADALEHEHDDRRHAAVSVDLDAAGFEHTRRVLEGVAADGRQWIA